MNRSPLEPGCLALRSLLVLLQLLLVSLPALAAESNRTRAEHLPITPKSREEVRVVLQLTPSPGITQLVLEYQVNAPGAYIALNSPRYATDWKALSMEQDRQQPGRWVGIIPSEIQKHRHLIRYRIKVPGQAGLAFPEEEDTQPNGAYFVYDGLPSWRGAVNPQGNTTRARQVVEYPPEVLSRVPVYHFISSARSAQEALVTGGENYDWGDRHEYRHFGTMVYDGVVYDHVKFRARGGAWRYAMGKNMIKFNFNAGHRFRARDNHGRPYATRWDKLNLGACIQQGDYGMRGEQGMFDALSYRLFNLAGCEAPLTHWVHFRLITGAEESPADQYKGDFQGLYLAVEEVDGDFLKQHRLPDGNIYKIEFGLPKPEHFAAGSPTNSLDARTFLNRLGQRQGLTPEWWRTQVDLPGYHAYRATVEAVHHYDISDGKNYFFYHNLKSGKWHTIPWDVDLTWGNHMYGAGNDPWKEAGAIATPALKAAYQERLAELRDLLFNPEQLHRLIDEHAAVIWNGREQVSIADADRAKWDYHPVMSSRYSMRGKSDPGLFYNGKVENRFDVMIALLKRYAQERQRHLDALLSGYAPPANPRLRAPAKLDLSGPPPQIEVDGAQDARAFQWRLAEVTDPLMPGFDSKQPWKYEIQPVWESGVTNSSKMTVPVTGLRKSAIYRARVRAQAADGRWSRWSAPVQWKAE